MVIHGDCTIELPKLEVSVDMVFTDPPYDISNDNNSSMISFEYSSYTSNKGEWDKEVPSISMGAALLRLVKTWWYICMLRRFRVSGADLLRT